MTVEEMRVQKEKRHLSNEDIARISGVPFPTVQKIFSGVTASPRKATLQALERAFPNIESGYSQSSISQSQVPAQPAMIKEASPAYQYHPQNILQSKKQGEFTIEDYLKLPDDQRYELIDGVLYAMSSPATVHQLIAGRIYAQLLSFVDANGGSCVPFIAPMDIMPDPNDRKTILEPDVMVVCDRDKIYRPRIYGAPDFVVEVLSKSTRTKDIIIKTAKYQSTGVREYWMIDPDRKSIMKYLFEGDDTDLKFYTFEDKVPIHIFQDECIIDFKKISESVAFIYKNEGKPEP